MLSRVVALGLVSWSVGRVVLAQTPARQRRDSMARDSLERSINKQALVRVVGAWGTAYLDHPRLAADTLTYVAAESSKPSPPPALPRPLTLAAVGQIAVRGNAAGTGALVGAGVGLAGGLAASLALISSLCDTGDCSNETGGAAIITVVGTAGGALIGALIGTTVKKWKTVYRAPH